MTAPSPLPDVADKEDEYNRPLVPPAPTPLPKAEFAWMAKCDRGDMAAVADEAALDEDEDDVARMPANVRLPDDAAPRTKDAASSGADSNGDCKVGYRPEALVAVVVRDGEDCAVAWGCCRCCCPATGSMDL
jgi:hypothetical protein